MGFWQGVGGEVAGCRVLLFLPVLVEGLKAAVTLKRGSFEDLPPPKKRSHL